MVRKSYVVTSEHGIHARPATKLVHLAMNFESDIDLVNDGKTINLKSIMGLMSLGIYQGAIIELVVEGKDQEEALKQLGDFIKTEKLGEEK